MDLIKREDAIKAIEERSFAVRDWYTVKAIIRNVPSAEPKQGEWILECDAEGEDDNLYRCSECGCNYGCQEYDIPNFCPNCGARMTDKDIDVPNKEGAGDETD